MRAINPIAPRRCAGASQPALQAILRVTAAQWAQALRAEGAVARAAVIESLATRIGAARRSRPVPPSFARREAAFPPFWKLRP